MTTIVNDLPYNTNHLSVELTEFANSKDNHLDLKKTLNFIAPAIPVARRFEHKKAPTDQFFSSEDDDIRATGSNFKYMDFQGESITAKTLNKGLGIRIDVDDINGNDWQTRYVYALQEQIYRNELRRVIKALIANAADGGDLTWANDASPDADIRKALVAACKKHGFYPNRLLYSEPAWFIRQDCYAAQENAGARIAAEMSRETLAEMLRVDAVQLLKQNNLGIQGQLKDNSVFAFYAEDSMFKDALSNLKYFVTLSPEGHFFRVYVEEYPKYTDIIVECFSTIAVTSKTNLIHWKIKDA
ncbi:MAG: hypothetical protein MJ218_03530 [Opitutales bacterium]|nr:hypothetical protein [Opitutales bacterium]